MIFLLVGAAFILSGFGWATSQKQVVEKEQQRAEAVGTKNEALHALKEADSSLNQQKELNHELIGIVPPPAFQQLKQQKPNLVQTHPFTLSPKLKAQIAKLPANP